LLKLKPADNMTGLIVLAAGSSNRFGSPKQNLNYKGKTLLQTAIETALASVCEPVIVILGANAGVIRPTIESSNIIIVQNLDWEEGMASSIRSGIKELQIINPDAESVILMLCDQPFVDTYLLNMLIMIKSKVGIAVCSYNKIVGPPVLFDAIYFEELLLLKGNEGAKKLIEKHSHSITKIPFPAGGIDIDTIEDYQQINK
jgi:molybdenum cofactor cytidylyltransferase